MSLAQQKNTSRVVDRSLELLDQIDYRLAETETDKEAIYRLRYDAYLKEGTIAPNRDRRVTDRFDDLPNSWIFGIHHEGVLTSSIRISVATPQHSQTPSIDVFHDLLLPELARGRVIVDPTRFVADPFRAGRFPELPYLTLRLAYVACGFFNADLGLATVRAEHQAFYRKVFMHQPLSEPRTYPGLTKRICLMAVEYQSMREKVFARYPYLRSSYFERRKLFERREAPGTGGVELTQFQFERASIAPGD
jgi:hypothetical protein